MLWAFHCSAQEKHEHIKSSLIINHIKSWWALAPGKTTTNDVFNQMLMDIYLMQLHECKPKHIFISSPQGIYQNNYFKDNKFILSEKVLFPELYWFFFALLTVNLPFSCWYPTRASRAKPNWKPKWKVHCKRESSNSLSTAQCLPRRLSAVLLLSQSPFIWNDPLALYL